MSAVRRRRRRRATTAGAPPRGTAPPEARSREHASPRECRTAAFAGGRFVALMAVLATYRVGVVRAYAVYEDGTIEQSLPGSASDSRGLPNSPFSVDSNRLSDGFSSVSPLSTTSPSFPLYRNGTDDSGNEPSRYWANLTMTSRLEQGVATRGAGSFETAVARYNALQESYSSEKPSVTFPVHAWRRWNPSGFAIQQGETYAVQVPGEQYWEDGRIRADAAGYSTYYDAVDACWVANGRCRSYLHGSQPRVPAQYARWMELVCGIGDFVTALREAMPGEERYLPAREPIDGESLQASLMAVGRNLTFVAAATGELVCFANDAEGLYGNNRASLNVTVTRESWPPDGTYVEENYDAYLDEDPPVVYP
ncbi:unnamed protein product [Ectocarpus sp. 4 AP-2014]